MSRKKNYYFIMKKFFAVFVFVLLTSLLFGQGDYQDVVYLKNGSIIRGVIIEQVPNVSIKIETVDKNVFVYQIAEIEKITKEPYQGRAGSTSRQGTNGITLTNASLNTGYSGLAELGFQIGVGDYGMSRLKLDYIYSYQLSSPISLGLGTGLRYFFDAEEIAFPFFADFRANFSSNKTNPYLSLGLGYLFNKKFNGVGFLLAPTVGTRFIISENTLMNIGLGYEMQKMDIYVDDYSYGHVYSENCGAISIIVGMSF